MLTLTRRLALALFFALAMQGQAAAQDNVPTAAELNEDSRKALKKLVNESQVASAVYDKALAVLVFPTIVKGGLIVGGEYGEGTLFKDGGVAGHYNIAGASLGLQAGAQTFSQAIFFMTEEALEVLNRRNGFQAGVDLGFAVGIEGAGAGGATGVSTEPAIAFAFGQQGLMAGVTLQGAKITPVDRK